MFKNLVKGIKGWFCKPVEITAVFINEEGFDMVQVDISKYMTWEPIPNGEDTRSPEECIADKLRQRKLMCEFIGKKKEEYLIEIPGWKEKVKRNRIEEDPPHYICNFREPDFFVVSSKVYNKYKTKLQAAGKIASYMVKTSIFGKPITLLGYDGIPILEY